MSKIICDPEGFVRGFAYHDGYFEGVLASNDGREVHLLIRGLSGKRLILTLSEVTALRVDNFREGNIILNLRVMPINSAGADIERIVAERLFVDTAALPERLRVFLLESSYGAEVVALCGDVEVREGNLVLSTEASVSG